MSEKEKASMETGRAPGKLVVPSIFGQKSTALPPVKKK